MTAVVFTTGHWMRARAQRAQRGKAPRKAIIRTIAIREIEPGQWIISIWAKRFGVWAKPERICGPMSFENARDEAVRAWRTYRLPVGQVRYGENRLLPLHLDRSDVIGGAG